MASRVSRKGKQPITDSSVLDAYSMAVIGVVDTVSPAEPRFLSLTPIR